MSVDRRTLLQGTLGVTVLGALGLAGCSSEKSGTSSTSSRASGGSSLTLDHKAWQYDKTNDVYYQLGRVYVGKPAAKDYESLGIYVPGAYLSAKENGDGTYTARVNRAGKVGSFSASTAPIVFPVNTPGYAAQKPPTSYSYDDVSSYLKAGCVYVAAGLRGKDTNSDSYSGNAPWGVTDLKAAVRYLRYNADVVPGDTDRIFVFGHSGGGAQSSVMGASGDSELYTPYLRALGAAMTTAKGRTISDSVAGVMAWCPITSLDYANAAYEWNMGQFASSGTRASGTWTSAYSGDLSAAFAKYLNQLRLKDGSGNPLSLTTSASGTYLAGSYYDYLVSVIEKSLNNFLSDTTFPYTPSNDAMAGMGGGAPPGGSAPTGAPPSGGAAPAGGSQGGSSSSTTYKTVGDYIDHLNSGTTWVRYDATTNTATVSGLAGFVQSQKNASKDVGAFDGIARGQTENVVMGLGADGLHFAQVSHDVIAANEGAYSAASDWKSSYAASQYAGDITKTDTVGKGVAYRSNMYNPMYYLSRYYQGYKSASVAPHWRIRTGIMQGDTASTTEVNLVLALQDYGIKNVDFATVWGQGHTMAERTGDATTNFITWVKDSVAS